MISVELLGARLKGTIEVHNALKVPIGNGTLETTLASQYTSMESMTRSHRDIYVQAKKCLAQLPVSAERTQAVQLNIERLLSSIYVENGMFDHMLKTVGPTKQLLDGQIQKYNCAFGYSRSRSEEEMYHITVTTLSALYQRFNARIQALHTSGEKLFGAAKKLEGWRARL